MSLMNDVCWFGGSLFVKFVWLNFNTEHYLETWKKFFIHAASVGAVSLTSIFDGLDSSSQVQHKAEPVRSFFSKQFSADHIEI